MRHSEAALPACEWAAEQAAALLSPLGDRWRHVLGVVGAARRVMHVLDADEGRWLVAAAYLHDIGYAHQLVDTGCHAIDGARWLSRGGHHRLARLVAHHSGARFEAHVRWLGPELVEFGQEDSPTADALTYCDLTTGPTGAAVTVDERVADIFRWYGEGHHVTAALRLALPSLLVAVRRTEERLAAAGPAAGSTPGTGRVTPGSG